MRLIRPIRNAGTGATEIVDDFVPFYVVNRLQLAAVSESQIVWRTLRPGTANWMKISLVFVDYIYPRSLPALRCPGTQRNNVDEVRITWLGGHRILQIGSQILQNSLLRMC